MGTLIKRAPKPIKSKDPDIEELSRQVCELFREFNPFASGTMLEFEINTLPAQKRVHHKLGRVPNGWILMRLVADDLVEFIEKRGLTDSQFITFESSLPCSVKVWIY